MFMGVMGVGRAALYIQSANNVSGLDTGPGASGTVTSDTNADVTPAGGAGGNSFAWELVSVSQGPTPSIISGGDTASPVWRATNVGNGVPSISTWRCTVTDAALDTAEVERTVTLTWESEL